MKKYKNLILLMFICIIGIGLFFIKNDKGNMLLANDNYGNLHEKQNFESINNANLDTENRLKESYNIYVNDAFVDVGYNWDGSIFLPIRSVAESLNWTVHWIPEKQVIQLKKNIDEAFVNVVNLFGKAYIDMESIEYTIKIQNIEILEDCIYISTLDSVDWKHIENVSKPLNFYINDMLMTKNAYLVDDELYIPTKAIASSLGKVYRYNAEEASVSIDWINIDSVLINNIPYSSFTYLKEVLGLDQYEFRYDNQSKGSKDMVPVYKGARGKMISLTFDDYIDDEVLPLLDVLDEYNVKATFFTIGNTLNQNKEVLKEVQKRGHIIGNHTWDHLNNHSITEDEFRAQLIATQLTVQEITGLLPTYYRPPGGFYNEKMLNIANEIGLKTIMWSINSNDALFDSKPDIIKDTVLNNISDGSIIVMHTKRTSTIEALPEIIKEAKEKGYEFVSIDELIALRSENHENK